MTFCDIPLPLLACVLGVWVLFIAEVSPQWSIDPDYNYGWAVPLLFLFLLARRWQSRPETARARGSAFAALAVAALAILPVKLIKEANPDWLLPTWTITLLVIALFLLLAYTAGGAPWARHFAPPAVFLVTAVPWPFFLEHAVVLGLTGVVTRVATEILVFWGIPAVQHGNVIEGPTGMVGIEEACSGIRSLQAIVMISLFLGAQFRLGLARTCWVLGFGAALAFVCNVARSTLLAGVAASRGIKAMENWHDPLGVAVLLVSFAGVWLLARMLAPNEPAPSPSARPHRFPVPAAVALIGWMPAAWLLTELWYRIHETNAPEPPAWTMRWPSDNPTFKAFPISELSRALLLYDEGSSAGWTARDGSHWQAYYFRWRPGLRAAQAAHEHVPEVCLPSSGMALVGNPGNKRLFVNKMDVPFERYQFDNNGRMLYVFRCVSNDLTARESAPVNWSRTDRLTRVLQGKRQRGDQRVLEVIVSGYDTPAQAETAFRRELEKLIRS